MRSLILCAVVLCAVTAARADIVANYDFTGLSGVTANVSGTPISGASLSLLTRGSGVTAASGANSYSSTAWTTGTTIDVNDYYSFTITPDVGKVLNLTNIAFGEERSGTGIGKLEIRSSLDSFGAAITGTVTTIPDNTNKRNETYALPAAFTGLTSAVTFQLYGYVAEAAGGSWRIENSTGTNGLQLTGTVTTAVPEAPAALLGVAVCGMVGLVYGGKKLIAKKA